MTCPPSQYLNILLGHSMCGAIDQGVIGTLTAVVIMYLFLFSNKLWRLPCIAPLVGTYVGFSTGPTCLHALEVRCIAHEVRLHAPLPAVEVRDWLQCR